MTNSVGAGARPLLSTLPAALPALRASQRVPESSAPWPASSPTAPSSALAAAGDHLMAVEPRLGFTIGEAPDREASPDGGPAPEWVRLDRLEAPVLSGWIDAEAAEAAEVGGHRGIVTGWMAEALVRRVVAPAVACWATRTWLPELRPENILVRRASDRAIDRTALASGLFAVPLTDPAAVDPWAWPVTSALDLRQWFGVGLVRVLEPLFDTVRQAGRFGRRGLWGLAADSAASALVRLVRLNLLTPASAAHTWDEVTAGFDLAARLGAPAQSRPRVRTDQCGPIDTLVSVRGVCCLYCATPAGSERPEPDRYCGSCPRLGETDRMTRLTGLLNS